MSFQVDQILGQVLRNAVWERLDMLADLGNRADEASLASVARTELPRLADGWRDMLRAHEPDARGDCPACSTRWHRSKAPCQVWQVAHEHLIAGGLAAQHEQGGASTPRASVPRQHPDGDNLPRHALVATSTR